MRVKNKKKISIVKYLMTWCVVMIVVFSVFMVICVNAMADYAINGAVSKQLLRQMRKVARSAVMEQGEITFSDKIKDVDDDFYFVILDKDKKVIAGAYPDGYDPKADNSGLTRLRVVKCNKTSYYVESSYQLLKRKANIEGAYTLQGFVECKDVSTIYHNLKQYSYIAVLIEFLVMALISILLHRRISKPIQEMFQQTEKITEDLDLSERLDYEGSFAELDVLFKAYNKLLARMENVVSRQEQFNSDVSHELRTPITVIRAQCQLTREQIASGDLAEKEVPAMEEMIDIIERQSNKMNLIVEQLLNLSRMDQDRMPFEIEEIDLIDIVEFVCEEEGIASGDEHRFEYDISSTVVKADVALITMAVRNLVSNAIKYSEKGTPIHVSCGRNDFGAYVSVQDFGCGIAKEDFQRIFEHYYRTEESRNSEGFGLGLTLAMKIAKKHGGTIHVESTLGEGSTFTLYIPESSDALPQNT